MPSKKQKAAGWILPNPIEGYPLICYCVPIPDVPEYRSAFLGQMAALGKWWNWEKSYTVGDRRATTAAALFRGLYEEITVSGCSSFDIRQNPENDCEIQKSLDGGETWETAWFLDNCAPPTYTYRYNLDTGILERSPDMGTTWEDDTQHDGRFISPFATLPDIGDTRCKAAQNVVTFLTECIEEFDSAIETGASAIVLMGIITAIIAAILSAGTSVPISIALIGAILYLTSEQFDNLFDTEFWDDMLCFIYCNTQDNGTFSYANWTTLSDEVETEFPTQAGTIIKLLFWLMGTSGLNNAGASGAADGLGCAECDCGEGWTYVWTNSSTPIEFGTVLTGSFDAPNKYYEANKSTGWNVATSTANVVLEITPPLATNITRLIMTVQNQVAQPANQREQYIMVYPDGGAEFKVKQYLNANSGTWVIDSGGMNQFLTKWRFVSSVKIANVAAENNNFTHLTRLEIHGTGVNPFE